VLILDTSGFGSSITQQLTGNCKGYSFELRRSGTTILTESWGNAVDGQLEGGSSLPWSSDVNMNIASCSKLVTAIALTKIINESPAGLSADDLIHPYLPSYWNPGQNVELITFTDVMTQTSGLKPGPSGFSQTYVPCREAVEAGVIAANLGGAAQRNYNHWDYENTNFVLCRILMATVSGAVSVGMTGKQPTSPPIILGNKHLTPQQADDVVWDFETTQFYTQYVQEHIFTPAAVSASLDRPGNCALAYGWNVAGTSNPADNKGDGSRGWNDGDVIAFPGNPGFNSSLADWAGPSGWHMSVSALLDVMGTFRRAGTIMSPEAAQAMLDASFGIDWGDNGVPQTSAVGPLYIKNGGDSGQDGAGNTAWEQSGAVFLPLDMECVAFVNSSVWPSSFFLLTTIANAFIGNLVESPVIVGPGGHPTSPV